MARLYVLFASVYLLEGITEVPFILNVYLSKILEFPPSQVARTLFLGGIWFILLKPVIGFLADSGSVSTPGPRWPPGCSVRQAAGT